MFVQIQSRYRMHPINNVRTDLEDRLQTLNDLFLGFWVHMEAAKDSLMVDLT